MNLIVNIVSLLTFSLSSTCNAIKLDVFFLYLVDDQDECEPRSEKSCTEATNLIGESDFNLEPNHEISDEATESFDIDQPTDTPEIMSPDQQE